LEVLALMKLNKYVIQQVFLFDISNSYAKRKALEADKISTRDLEKSIKDEIKERLSQANLQREVCDGIINPLRCP